MRYKKILISSPSLDERRNISGIAAIVSPLLKKYPFLYQHLKLGTSDGNKTIINRINSLLLPVFDILKVDNKNETLLHLNTALNLLSLLRDFLILSLASVLRIPVVLHFHGGYWMKDSNIPFAIVLIVKFMIHLSRACIVLGPIEADILVRFYGIKSKVNILPNYIPDEFFDFTEENVKKHGQILFLGRLVKSKNIESLPIIVEHLIQRGMIFKIIICGDGPLKDALLTSLNCFPTKFWKYEGVVMGARKIELLRESSIFILPSISGEGMPIAMLEAMASGCVPIGTKLGSIPSVIDDDFNGCIATPGDNAQFLEKIINLLNNKNIDFIKINSIESSKKFSLKNYEFNLFNLYENI